MEPEKQQDLNKYKVVCSQPITLKLQSPLQKILGFCPMFDGTYVILGIKQLRVECVAHYDHKGKLIKSKQYLDSNFYPYIIPTNQQIFWVDTDSDFVYCWNLKTDQYLQWPFKFNNDTADTHEIFYFPDTKLVCIGEWGRHDSCFFRLSYFQHPLTLQSEPVHVFETDDVWNYQYTVRTANLQTKFIWWKCAMKEEIQFRCYELVNKNGKWEGIYTRHQVANPFKTGQSPTELSVGCIWEMTPKKYMIVSISDRPYTETEYPNALFVYEENNKLFRQANFAFEGKYRYQYIHYYSFGRLAMIRSFDFVKGQSLQTPVYYIDNQNQCIAARGAWKCSHLNKFTLSGYNGNMIIDAQYENGDVQQIRWKSIESVKLSYFQQYDQSCILANMCLQVFGQIDEDLLSNIVELAQNQQNVNADNNQ